MLNESVLSFMIKSYEIAFLKQKPANDIDDICIIKFFNEFLPENCRNKALSCVYYT